MNFYKINDLLWLSYVSKSIQQYIQTIINFVEVHITVFLTFILVLNLRGELDLDLVDRIGGITKGGWSTRGVRVARVCGAQGKKQNGANYFSVYIFLPNGWSLETLRGEKWQKREFHARSNVSHLQIRGMSYDLSFYIKTYQKCICFGYAKWLILYFLPLARFCAPWKWRPGQVVVTRLLSTSSVQSHSSSTTTAPTPLQPRTCGLEHYLEEALL